MIMHYYLRDNTFIKSYHALKNETVLYNQESYLIHRLTGQN